MDYPRTLQEFDEWFPTVAPCIAHIERFRCSLGLSVRLTGKMPLRVLMNSSSFLPRKRPHEYRKPSNDAETGHNSRACPIRLILRGCSTMFRCKACDTCGPSLTGLGLSEGHTWGPSPKGWGCPKDKS